MERINSKKIDITIPAGFTWINTVKITAAGTKSWSSNYNLGVLTLTAAPGSGNYLDQGQEISVQVTVTAQLTRERLYLMALLDYRCL